MPQHVFFHIPGRRYAQRNFPQTVFSKVSLAQIEAGLPSTLPSRDHILCRLRKLFPQGEMNCWGAPSGAISTMQHMQPGDTVLLLESSAVGSNAAAVGQVAAFWPVELPELSQVLWGESRFPYIFFFNADRISLTWEKLKAVLGYSPKYRTSHFIRVDPDRIQQLGGAAGVRRQVLNLPISISALAQPLFLEFQTAAGRSKLLRFEHPAIRAPTLIRLHGPHAPQAVDALARAIERSLLALGPAGRVRDMALPGQYSAAHLFYLGLPRLLILVGDGKRPTPFPSDWPPPSPQGNRVLCVLPSQDRLRFAKLVPPTVQRINGAFWSRGIQEVVPAVLSAVGLTPERPRIFISYRQTEASDLAAQLADELAHAHFDVFLDHFSIPPGVDFQARLTEELGHKSMVLILATAGIFQSRYVRHEINLARRMGLGVFVLRLPGGPLIRRLRLDALQQCVVTDADCIRRRLGHRTILRAIPLKAVIQAVRAEHDRAALRRHATLMNNTTLALMQAGVGWQDLSLTQEGHLRVSPSGSRPQYHLRLTPWPPESQDFHAAYPHVVGGSKAAVVGLTALMQAHTLAHTEWVAERAQMVAVSRGCLRGAASALQAGIL